MSPSSEQESSIGPSASSRFAQAVRTRCPAAVAGVALAVGILIDRTRSPGWGVWTVGAVCSVALAILLQKRSILSATILLIGSCVAVGGMRHHLSWSTVPADDIARLATETPRPVRVTGIVCSPLTIIDADDSELTPTWMRIDRSACDLACELVFSENQRVPVSGMARLVITGHVLHAQVGDRVDVIGQLARPGLPSNPGAFDYQEHLRKQGIHCLLSCDHPDAMSVIKPNVGWRLSRIRAGLRHDCEAILVRHLSPETVPLASSLLLGLRSQLPGHVRTAFAESGTMHLLAISGLHVGILAGLLLVGCRLINTSITSTTIILLLGVSGYAFVTNLRSPVVRASVLAIIAAAAWPSHRRVSAANLVAICALVVLLIDPTDLFDTGTQLSFLAVVAIGWAASFVSRQRQRIDVESLLPRLLAKRESRPATLLRLLLEGYVVTAAIWFVTLPLTIARFHIVAPVGFLMNVLLIPYVALLLAMGFVTIACGLLLPAVAGWPAAVFDRLLGGLLDVVGSASSLHLGHRYVAGPSEWWLIGFYGLLGSIVLFRFRPSVRRWGWPAVWSWVVLGSCTVFHSPHRESVRCTFLDVGHGCCVVLEMPEGQTLLYDAGHLGNQRRGLQIVQAALWDLGVLRIDGIVVSHADVDHFNVAAALMRTMPTGTLLASRTFLDFDQPAVDELCEAARQQRVPVRLIQTGDRLLTTDPRVSIEVVQPSRDWVGESDNANSVVLRVRFGSRSVLLAGDLEGSGLTELINLRPHPVDVLLAPHHGSRAANPRSLADWASPRFVVISGGDAAARSNLKSVYTDAERVLCTEQDGAITVEISASGHLTVRPFHEAWKRPR